METVIRRYELTDAEWKHLPEYFPDRQAGDRGNSRQILNGILWIPRSGAAWKDLPERYGAWQTIYKRFLQWQEAGLLVSHFFSLQAPSLEVASRFSAIRPIKIPVFRCLPDNLFGQFACFDQILHH